MQPQPHEEQEQEEEAAAPAVPVPQPAPPTMEQQVEHALQQELAQGEGVANALQPYPPTTLDARLHDTAPAALLQAGRAVITSMGDSGVLSRRYAKQQL